MNYKSEISSCKYKYKLLQQRIATAKAYSQGRRSERLCFFTDSRNVERSDAAASRGHVVVGVGPVAAGLPAGPGPHVRRGEDVPSRRRLGRRAQPQGAAHPTADERLHGVGQSRAQEARRREP